MGCASSTEAAVKNPGGTAAKYVADSSTATPGYAAGSVATEGHTAANTVAKPPAAGIDSDKGKEKPPWSSASDPASSSALQPSKETTNGAATDSKMPVVKAVGSDVSEMLLRVSTLISRFAEGRSERTTPIQALRRALDLVQQDSRASFISVQVLPDALDLALLLAVGGAPDGYHDQHRLLRVPQSGIVAEVLLTTGVDFFIWQLHGQASLPTDWHLLVTGGGMQDVFAVPIKVSDKFIGVLTLGFKEGAADTTTLPTYMQLIAASISSMVRDMTIPKYLALVRELHEAPDVDALMHKVVQHMRGVLGHTNNHHFWYRVALTASSNTAATIFDDLTQVPASLMQRNLGSQQGASGFKLLKDMQVASGVMRTVVAMKSTVMKISVHNRQQVMIPDVQKLINQSGNVSIDIFNTRLIKPPTSVLVFPLKVKQHIFGVIFCMSSVQTDFADVSARLRELCEVMSPHLLQIMTNALATDYKNVQSAQPGSSEGGSMSGMGSSRTHSMSGRSMGDSAAMSLSGESFIYLQSRSSTGALVTGLTEKLNQKRIKSSMDFATTGSLTDLQITNLLGEGGFAKVFRGLWRGLVVGVKVVCDDGKNEKMVMKNAHEIAILSALSHPNIMQAYTCVTDVLVRDMLQTSMRNVHPSVLASSAYKYLASMEDKSCHVEVIEYCDLGNMSTALKHNVFSVASPDKVLASAMAAGDIGSQTGSSDVRPLATGKVHMRMLLLTLIEVASAMCYLHRMGVVHCDLKPANVLLKSSSNDLRGFTAKVSDFGLSRVEDDDSHSSFPFNSCGTAAYVAPEALICNKKVNSSVDVYAFGILMWEMYTGQRPYGSMKQQQLVEEVVMRGLRPRFPSHTPPAYVQLAQACWSGSAIARPTFEEVLGTLNSLHQQMEAAELGSSMTTGSFGSITEAMEYMQGNGLVKGFENAGTGSAAASSGGMPPQQGQQQQSARVPSRPGSLTQGTTARGSFAAPSPLQINQAGPGSLGSSLGGGAGPIVGNAPSPRAAAPPASAQPVPQQQMMHLPQQQQQLRQGPPTPTGLPGSSPPQAYSHAPALQPAQQAAGPVPQSGTTSSNMSYDAVHMAMPGSGSTRSQTNSA